MASVVMLRGTATPRTVFNISGVQAVTSAYAVETGDTIWRDDLSDISQWHLAYEKTTIVQARANGVLAMNVTFSPQNEPQAMNLYRAVNISLDSNPVFSATVRVSLGIHYGVRLSGVDENNQTFNAWSESSNFQHRPGLGVNENLTLSAITESYLANGVIPLTGSRITSIRFYLEATVGQLGQFSLVLSHVAVSKTDLTSFNANKEVSGNINEIVLGISVPPDIRSGDQQFFETFIGFYVSGNPHGTYLVYYLQNLSVLARSYGYAASTKFSYNLAFLSPSLAIGFPTFIAFPNSTFIVVDTQGGSLTEFRLDDLSIRFLRQSATPSTLSLSDPTLLLAYYFGFLFVVPTAIVILLSRVVRREPVEQNA
jgi:hypothetical protein